MVGDWAAAADIAAAAVVVAVDAESAVGGFVGGTGPHAGDVAAFAAAGHNTAAAAVAGHTVVGHTAAAVFVAAVDRHTEDSHSLQGQCSTREVSQLGALAVVSVHVRYGLVAERSVTAGASFARAAASDDAHAIEPLRHYWCFVGPCSASVAA